LVQIKELVPRAQVSNRGGDGVESVRGCSTQLVRNKEFVLRIRARTMPVAVLITLSFGETTPRVSREVGYGVASVKVCSMVPVVRVSVRKTITLMTAVRVAGTPWFGVMVQKDNKLGGDGAKSARECSTQKVQI